MHQRKNYIVYPHGYNPLHGWSKGYVKVKSRRQAKKTALKMGQGAEVDMEVTVHAAKHSPWINTHYRGTIFVV